MQRNVGTVDRAVRGLVGLALLAIFFLMPLENVYLHWGSLVVGIVMIGTAAIGWCPPYAIFGISTCSKGDAK